MNLDRLPEILLRDLPDALIVSDVDGVIRFWNAGAERVFGFAAAAAVGRSLDIIIPERLRDRHWAGYAETMRSGRTRYGAGDLLAVPALHAQGHLLSIQFSIVILRDDSGRPTGTAAVLRDVTRDFDARKALERELAVFRRAARPADDGSAGAGASLGCPEHWRRLHGPVADPAARVGPPWLPRAE